MKIKILTAAEGDFEKALNKWQKDGWKVAGPVIVTPDFANGKVCWIRVPMGKGDDFVNFGGVKTGYAPPIDNYNPPSYDLRAPEVL